MNLERINIDVIIPKIKVIKKDPFTSFQNDENLLTILFRKIDNRRRINKSEKTIAKNVKFSFIQSVIILKFRIIL